MMHCILLRYSRNITNFFRSVLVLLVVLDCTTRIVPVVFVVSQQGEVCSGEAVRKLGKCITNNSPCPCSNCDPDPTDGTPVIKVDAPTNCTDIYNLYCPLVKCCSACMNDALIWYQCSANNVADRWLQESCDLETNCNDDGVYPFGDQQVCDPNDPNNDATEKDSTSTTTAGTDTTNTDTNTTTTTDTNTTTTTKDKEEKQEEPEVVSEPSTTSSSTNNTNTTTTASDKTISDVSSSHHPSKISILQVALRNGFFLIIISIGWLFV